MSYFDIQWDTMVLVDASPIGISAILTQKEKGTNGNRIIAHASRAFTPVEKRYSQTEREALSIVWGIEYFHLYLFGAPFTLYTDHKQLELMQIRAPNPLQEFKGGCLDCNNMISK